VSARRSTAPARRATDSPWHENSQSNRYSAVSGGMRGGDCDMHC
jgi:hypothetical protein